MNKGLGFIIGLVVAVLAVGGIYKVVKNNNKTPSTTTSSSTTPTPTQSTTPTPAATDQTTDNTITYSSSGFALATLTVKAGTTVTFKNSSSDTIQIDSNPHPVHTDNSELNIGSIEPGQSLSVMLTRKGTWHYHNHLNPNMSGTIVVE